MKNNELNYKKPGFICSENNRITKVSRGFLILTGYEESDFLGKSLKDLGGLLKTDAQIEFEKIEEGSSLYIFNNESRPIDVVIRRENLEDESKKIYYVEEDLESGLPWILLNFENARINKEAGVAIYSYPDYIHLKVNERYSENLRLIGLEKGNIIGKVISYSQHAMKGFEKENSYHKHEVEFVDQDGNKTYWDVELNPVLGSRGKKQLVGTFYDVTKRVIARNALKKQRVEMEIILDHISDSIVKINNEGRFVYVNKAGREKLAYYNPDVTSIDYKQVHTFFKRSDIDGNELSIEESPEMRVLRGEKLSDYIIIGTSDGPTTYHKCSTSPIYDECGNLEGGLLIFNDIEDIFKIEEYNALKDNVKDLTLSYLALSYDDFKIKYINETGFAAVKKTKPHIKSIGEVIGRVFFDLYLNDEDDLIDNIRTSMEEGHIYSHKKRFLIEGKEQYIKTIFQPVFDLHDKVEKVIAIGMDITDEELTHRQMAKALKVQEEIFVNTSHELKTPLNLIYSASQLLNLHLENEIDENTKNKLLKGNKIIMQNCYRLTKLTNNILDISKMESGFYELSLSNYNIVDVIDSIVSSVAQYTNASGKEIIFETDMDDMIIAVDLYKFEKILLNLISNAIKFSNPNGLIVVKLVKVDGVVELSVEDDGIGIEKENKKTIFNKFTQLNTSLNRMSEGSGVGLSLVKSIAELHGGSVRVESVLNQGSIFTVELPIITLDNIKVNEYHFSNMSQSEIIKIELSDIYS